MHALRRPGSAVVRWHFLAITHRIAQHIRYPFTLTLRSSLIASDWGPHQANVRPKDVTFSCSRYALTWSSVYSKGPLPPLSKNMRQKYVCLASRASAAFRHSRQTRRPQRAARCGYFQDQGITLVSLALSSFRRNILSGAATSRAVAPNNPKTSCLQAAKMWKMNPSNSSAPRAITNSFQGVRLACNTRRYEDLVNTHPDALIGHVGDSECESRGELRSS